MPAFSRWHQRSSAQSDCLGLFHSQQSTRTQGFYCRFAVDLQKPTMPWPDLDQTYFLAPSVPTVVKARRTAAISKRHPKVATLVAALAMVEELCLQSWYVGWIL